MYILSALTKSQFAFVIGHCMQQGDGATGIGCCLLQEINSRVFCNLVCLLLSERLMLQQMQTKTQRMIIVIGP